MRRLLQPALDGSVFDVAQAALMFPMAFTGTLMGLPSEHWPRMAELTTMTVAYDDPDYSTGSPTATVRQAHHELFDFFRTEVTRRPRTDPGTDLIGILRSMDLDEDPLSERQLMLNCYALLLGANAGFAALPNLTTIAFTNATVNGANANLQSAQELQLIDSNGNVIGSPSAPNATHNGFDVCAWATSCS